jgi:hypothetical protein
MGSNLSRLVVGTDNVAKGARIYHRFVAFTNASSAGDIRGNSTIEVH